MDEMSVQGNMMYAMLEVVEAFSPIFDAAKGLKVSLIEQGFSEHTAEKCAAEFLQGCIRKALNQ